MTATRPPLAWRELPPGRPHLVAAVDGADLVAHDYLESEWSLSGTAEGYRALATPADGRWDVAPVEPAAFTTRAVLRRPRDPVRASGVVVVEWLNVSSGEDTAPDFRYLGEEIVRRGHVWLGLSAQRVGVEGGASAVAVSGAAGEQLGGGLKAHDPERYGHLVHPGDLYSYGILSEVLVALRAGAEPLRDLDLTTFLVAGESQSAYALTTYANAVQPLVGAADGFLVHSRGGTAMSLGRAGEGMDLAEDRAGEPTRIRTDLDVPVLVVQAETDVLSSRLWFLPARQPDHALLRTWEIAGTAHADRWQIGEFESFLGGPDPVNRGQQGYVVRAALRRLEEWVRQGTAPPSAAPLEVAGDPPAFVTDELGNVAGGVRTPVVDVAVEVHSGLAREGAPLIVQLFGRTLPADPGLLATRYADRSAYLQAYREATDRAIASGFVLPEDRDAVLAEARPDLLPG